MALAQYLDPLSTNLVEKMVIAMHCDDHKEELAPTLGILLSLRQMVETFNDGQEKQLNIMQFLNDIWPSEVYEHFPRIPS